MSLLYFANSLVSGEHLQHLLFFKKKYLSPFIKLLECVTILEDEIVNNKGFEHANLIFTEPWASMNEIMLNIMQNVKFDLLKSEF